MTYHSGQRIVLVHTDDEFTDLHPGDKGTVTAFDPQLRIVAVSWDSGSELSMWLDAGDRIRVIAEPADSDPDTTTAGQPSPVDAGDGRLPWGEVLAALRVAGAQAGRSAADWWAQDTVGGRTGGDTARTARTVLAGLDDGDPAVLDALPTVFDDAEDADGQPDWYTAALEGRRPRWNELTAAQRHEALDAYSEAADTAVRDRVTEACRATPDGIGHGGQLTDPQPEPGQAAVHPLRRHRTR